MWCLSLGHAIVRVEESLGKRRNSERGDFSWAVVERMLANPVIQVFQNLGLIIIEYNPFSNGHYFLLCSICRLLLLQNVTTRCKQGF